MIMFGIVINIYIYMYINCIVVSAHGLGNYSSSHFVLTTGTKLVINLKVLECTYWVAGGLEYS